MKNPLTTPGAIPAVLLILFLLADSTTGFAQETTPRVDLYGFAMLDMGYDANQVDPSWFDVLRPTKLPSFADQFGKDGRTYASVRQSRLGFKGYFPTPLGELRTIFEFEMFGVGVDAGQTTIRLRHAYGELGQFGAGQYWSPFMDIDVFPNSVEYWGPNGMVFFRNVQVRWMPIQGDTRMTIALERPGASGDQGIYSEYSALDGIVARFPLPDLSAEYRLGRDWGYVELAGIVRQMKWDDMLADSLELSGDEVGWGANLSSNIKAGAKDVIRLQVVYGEGIQNYMNDATVDVGVQSNPGNAVTPIIGVAIPMTGIVAFLDHNWNPEWSTAIGYSRLDMDNTDGQAPNAFKSGSYALANLFHYPAKGVMVGAELQWGRRENYLDGFKVDDMRLQFSFKYNFSATLTSSQ